MKVVFACKSNSCRSQMAEGWAREWLQQQKRRLLHQESSSPSSDGTEFLNTVQVASVALDSTSVFTQSADNLKKRKSVKEKAVQAMAALGVDISNCVPKTLGELLPTLFLSSTPNGSSVPSAKEECWSTLEMTMKANGGGGGGGGSEEETNPIDSDDSSCRPIDKLIVMYSCADTVKHHVVNQSQSVIQWDIEAPSAAAKAGEGDPALVFRRISLEIRRQVDELMEGLLLLHRQ